LKTDKVRKNIKKRLLNALLYTLLVLIFLPPGLAFLFHEPIVQTLAGRLATHILSSRIGNQASIDAVRIGIRKGITLDGVLVKDHRDSTLMKIDELVAKPVYADWGLFGIRFSKIELSGVEFRIAKYKGDEDLNLIMLINKFSVPGSTVASNGQNQFKLKSKKLFLNNALFQYYDEEQEFELETDMDYANIIFDSIFLDATNFVIVNDSLNFRINSMNTNERSGIKVREMQTDFSISNSGLRANGLIFTMNNSNFDLDFGFNYNSYRSYSEFIDSVVIYADIRPSEMFMSDIGFFTNVMKKMPNRVGLTGKVYGTISDFKGDDVRVHYGRHTRLALDAEITGLPDFFSSYLVADFREVTTTACELKTIFIPVDKEHLDYTAYADCNDLIKFNGKFEGYYNDFKTDFDLKSDEGDLSGDLLFTLIENDTLHFDLHATGDTIKIGKLLDEEKLLGNVNFKLNLKGHGNNWLDVKIKSNGTLRTTDFMDYNYSRIRFSGRYQKDRAEGNIVVGDRNLMMSADVVANLKEEPELGIVASIRKAHLDNLNMWKGYDFSFSTNAAIKMKGLSPDSMTGKAILENSSLFFGKEEYYLSSAILEKRLDESGIHTIDLKSDIADLNLRGKYNITTLPDRIIALTNHYIRLIPQQEDTLYPEKEYADLKLTLYNDELITDQFVPGLSLSDNIFVDAEFDFQDDIFNLTTNVENMDISGIEMKDNKLQIVTNNNALNLEYSNSNMIFRDSTSDDKTVFGLDNFSLKASAMNDSLAYQINWNNVDSLLNNRGDLSGYYKKTVDNDYFKIAHADVLINDTSWTIDPENSVVIDTTGAWFKNVNINGGKSRINFSGKLPRKDGDSLNVSFDKWNLSNFDMITRLWRFDLDGIINGDFQYGLFGENPVISSNITIDHLALNKEYLGKAELINTWNNSNKSISIKTKVTREGTSGSGEVLSISGVYFPFKDEQSLDLDILFNRLKIGALEPFFADFISQLEGVAAGELKLAGSAAKPVLTGFVDMHRTQLLINYLNTKYSFSNVINFEKDKISFDELVIYDTLGNFASVDGNLSHQYFENTAFDVKISTDKLLAFNTTRKMNELYYGTGLVAGNIKIGGTALDISLDMKMTSLEGTDVKLPMDYSLEISDKDYIIFVNRSDSLEQDVELTDFGKIKKNEDKLEYDINMDLNITPRTNVTIYLPSEMGRIESEGRGKINMKTNTSGDFTMVGDYTIHDGLFHFTLANLVSKRFDLVKGGRISWTGDPYTANLNIKGLYRVKTSLSSLGLMIDSTTTYRNKVNVDCYIILKNQLLNPDIRFEILFPDLNPDLQRMVYAELDTTNQAMMNEQMISLLVLGTFSYSNASNINLGTAAYYSVLTNQLSSMLSKISDDFDIGVNYKPGDNVSQEEFEVALSTQLFDERLMIDGNFGMTYDRTGQNASNIVGDVDIGYKITEDGQWILKAFNHSNVNSWYNYANYDKVSPYTQGVGIAFRKEFTHISELFKRTKPKKNKSKNEENKDATKED